MPDAFGNPTPQEVLAAIRQRSRQSFIEAQRTGSPGVQAGASLGALFGGAIRKTLDTRAARKTEAQRLIDTQGLSREQAEQQARETIGREFAEVRTARRVQDAQSDIQEFMDTLDPSIPQDMRRAQGMLFLSNRMRSMGLVSQANQLASQASLAIQAAEDRALEIQKINADIRSTEQSISESEAREANIGRTAFQQNVIRKEQLLGQLDDPQSTLSQFDRESMLREIGHLEAKILKDETVVGRTEADVRDDPVAMRKMFNDLSDSQTLINQLTEAEVALDNLDSFEASIFGKGKARLIGFAEEWLGREPDESEQDFLDRFTKAKGGAAFVAAQIRHALTGAQMSAFEIVFLTPFLPEPDDSKSTMKSKLRAVRAYTELDRDTRMTMFQQGLTNQFLEGVSETPARSFDNPATTPPADVTQEAVDAGQSITDRALSIVTPQE